MRSEMEADSEVRTMRAMQQMWGHSQSPGWQEMPQMIGATQASDWLMTHIPGLWLVNTRVTRCYKWSETWVADGGLWLRDCGVTTTSASSCCSEPLVARPHMHRIAQKFRCLVFGINLQESEIYFKWLEYNYTPCVTVLQCYKQYSFTQKN